MVVIVGSTAAVMGLVLLFAGCVSAATGASVTRVFILLLLAGIFWLASAIIMSVDERRDRHE